MAEILRELEGLDPQDEQDRAEIDAILQRAATEDQLIRQLERQADGLRCPKQPPPNTLGLTLSWSLVGNTVGFGLAINDGRPFWIGDFNGHGRPTCSSTSPATTTGGWHHRCGHRAAHVVICRQQGGSGRSFWIGDFNGDGRTDLLSYCWRDDN